MHAQLLIFHCADELSYFGTIKYYTPQNLAFTHTQPNMKKDNKRHKKIIKDKEIQLQTENAIKDKRKQQKTTIDNK